MSGRLLAVALAALVVAGACGNPASDDVGTAPTSTAPDPEVEPAGTSVLLLGDSIMGELAAAVTEGVETAGDDRATFVLAPNLPHTAGDAAVWRRALDEARPDVVVLHISNWERLKVLGDFATGTRRDAGTYVPEVVEPALDLLETSGARVLWLGPLPVPDPQKTRFVADLAREWRRASAARGGDWLDLRTVVPATAPTRGPGQVRRDDGIHLCPLGQRLVAVAVLDRLAPSLTAPPPPGWDRVWLDEVEEPGGCGPYRPVATGR